MGVGEKIKEFRLEKNLTQKDLADRLHVTNQAVSRWENNEAEPSFDALRQISQIFGCTINDLFEMQSDQLPQPEPVREVQIIERVVPEPQNPILALCERCNEPIYKKEDIHRFKVKVRNGRTISEESHLYCTKCNNVRLQKEKEKKELERKKEISVLKKRRIRSFVYPSIIFAIFLVAGISSFRSADLQTGWSCIVTALLAFFFSACLFLKNNKMEDIWINIASWGFVRLPGVIMEFSLDGFIIGILIKIALWILGMILAIITILLATLVCLFVSPFMYPFAIIKNFKQVKGTVPFDEEKNI